MSIKLSIFYAYLNKHLKKNNFVYLSIDEEYKLVISINFIKKETLVKVFSCEFCKIFKNIFFKEHFWSTASVLCYGKYPFRNKHIVILYKGCNFFT